MKEETQDNLTEKQENYCQQYVICGNQSTAYRIAYDADAMNSNTVAVEACRLHSNPKISLRIQQIRQENYENNKMTISELLLSVSDMVRFDPADMYDDDGVLLPIKKMPKHVRQMIESLDTDELYTVIDGKREVIGHTKKIRTVKRLDAIEKFMRHLGLYEKDNAQSKPVNNVVINLGDGEPELSV